MRTEILSFIFLLSWFNHCSQTVISSCSAPDSVVKKYKKSADKLAIRRVDYIGDTYKDSVAINKQISNKYLDALLAVYNATALAARDTIVDIPIVLDNYPLALNLIGVRADSTRNWMKNLRNGILPCGEPAVDYLINKYYLKIDSYYHFFGVYASHSVVFRTDSNYYIRRLCDKFGALIPQGVVFSQPDNENMSYSADVTDSINPNFMELTYSVGWGEWAGCLSPNCPYRRYWTFRVNNDCSVEYKGSYGDALPPNSVFVGQGDNNSNLTDVKVYPNPVKDKLWFSFTNQLTISTNEFAEDLFVEIYDVSGRVLKKQLLRTDDNKCSVNFQLDNGIYFLSVANISNEKITKKIVISR